MIRLSKKTKQRQQLVLAMLQQPTLEKAAAAVGISSTTAWRIGKTPEFEEEMREAQRKAYGQSLSRLRYASPAAVNTIFRVMADPKTPASSQLRAADSVLHHAARGIELEDLGARIGNIEKVVMMEQQAQPC
jgi:hypothetical protein